MMNNLKIMTMIKKLRELSPKEFKIFTNYKRINVNHGSVRKKVFLILKPIIFMNQNITTRFQA